MALWQSPWSGADQAMADTLLRKAQGTTFDQLAAVLGVPRIASVPQPAWRRALHQVAYGPRGAPASTFAFLREAFRQHDTNYVVSVDPAPLEQNKITWVAGGPAAGFTRADLFRLWEINGVVYMSQNFGAAPGVAPWPAIHLVPYAGPHWRGCDWSKDSTLIAGVPTNRAAVRLPFTVRAVGATYQVFVDNTISIQPAPPTYMQQCFDWAISGWTSMAAVPTTFFPYRAEFAEQFAGNISYAGSATPTSNLQMFLVPEALTLSRIDFHADADPGVPVPARGGDYTATLMQFVAGVWAPTALAVTLGPAATHATAAGAVALPKGAVISLQLTRVPGASASLVCPRVQVSGARPAGQPEGGFVLGGAQYTAGQDGASAYPLYLYDDAQQEWVSLLDALLAAGVYSTVKYQDFNYPY